MEAYHKTLMWAMRLVAGDRETKTWTFHKGGLRVFGFDWVNRNPKQSLIRILWTVAYPTFYTLVLVFNVVLTVKAAIRTDKTEMIQFTRAMNGFIVSMAYVSGAIKVVLMKINGADLLRLMDLAESLGELDEIGRPILRETIYNSTLYMGLIYLIPTGWISYFIFVYQAIPYPTDFPWSETTTLGYMTSFGTDILAGVFCAGIHSLYDTLFPVVVGVLSGHLSSMRSRLAGLGAKTKTKTDEEVLREAHRLHVNLLRVHKLTKESFKFILLFQIMYTVVHACTIIYQVTQLNDVVLAIMDAAPFLVSAYAQLLMYCYYGQRLTSDFEELKVALYDNAWYVCSLKVKKSLALISIVADRPVRLEAFGITSASHTTYLSSFKDSISYYMILKTLTSEK